MYLFEFEFSPYICPGRSMRNPMINLFLVFQETSTLAAPAYISTGSIEGLLFLHALLSMLCIDFNIFIPLFLPVLGLVAARACCGRSELGRSVLAAHGLQQMGRAGSAVGARGCSCSVAGGICLCRGWSPRLFRGQADSLPPSQQGSPFTDFLVKPFCPG